MTHPSGPYVVVDASAVVALLLDSVGAGAWVRRSVRGLRAAAPSLMPFEAANSLRSTWLRGSVPLSELQIANRRLARLRFGYSPYNSRLAERAWELIGNLTVYDAAYVALAELLDAPLLTLDHRLARAPGLRCQVLAYEGS